MAYTCKWRFARITARKARLLTDLIRNKPVGEALDLLKFNKKRGAVMVAKVLKSAIANADAKEADVEELFISKSFCDDGPIMKRFMPKDRGKSFSIFKRLCHITIEVEEGTPPIRKGKLKQIENRKKMMAKKTAKKAANSEKSEGSKKSEHSKKKTEGAAEASASDKK
jgi:large subunit ribosomal protein L22